MNRKELVYLVKKKRTSENSIIIKKLLNEISHMADEHIYEITSDLSKNEIDKIILDLIGSNKRYSINSYFEYDLRYGRVNLHLPKDLHSEFEEFGKIRASAMLASKFIDAILEINEQRNNGLEMLQDKEIIYMMSPIFFCPTYKKIPMLEKFRKFGATTKKYTSMQLSKVKEILEKDEKDERVNDEMRLALKDFGTEKDVGIAFIEFEKINEKEKLLKLKTIKKFLTIYTKSIKNNKGRKKDDEEKLL